MLDKSDVRQEKQPAWQDILSIVAPIGSAASSPLTISSALTRESIRFWACRMQAYADWTDCAVRSTSLESWLQAQSAFWQRTQQDYLQEGTAIAAALAPERKPARTHSPGSIAPKSKSSRFAFR